MSVCSVQRGIFSLRECGNHATENCSACQCALCREHASYGREEILCPKCLAASPARARSDSEVDDADWESPGWSQRWSNNYNSSHAFVPLATMGNRQYDDFDRNAFSSRADGMVDEGVDGDGSANSSANSFSNSSSSFADS